MVGLRLTLFAAAVLIVLLFFPLVVYADGRFDLSEKKLYFTVRLFRLIPIRSGYASLYAGGIAFHLSKDKAVLLPFSAMKGARSGLELTKGFELISYRQLAEIGFSSPSRILAIGALQSAAGIFATVLGKDGHSDKIRSDVVLYESDDRAVISAQVGVAFNLAVLLAVVAKKIFGQKKEKVNGN